MHLSDYRFKLFIAATFLLFVLSGISAGELIEPGAQGVLELEHDRPGAPAQLYVPSDYTPSQKWPLIICLHGLRGKPTTGAWKTILDGKGYLIAGLNYADVPLERSGKWKGAYASTNSNDRAVRKYIRAAIEKIAANYHIDRDEIIYAGNSMGGWNIGNFCCTPDIADTFRGYIGWGCLTQAVNECKFRLAKGKPVMIYHGENCFVLKDHPVESEIRNLSKAGMNLTRIIFPGQGHGVSTEVCREPVSKWFEEIRLEDQMLKGFCPIEWQSGGLTNSLLDKSPASVTDYLKQQDFVKNRPEGKPILLWFYADESETSKNRVIRTKESLKSDKSFNNLFEYPEAVETIATARYFHCVSIALNGINKKENVIFNAEKAPMLVLISSNGEAVTLLNNGLNAKALALKMATLLNEEDNKAVAQGIAAFGATRKKWSELAKDYQKNQNKLIRAFQSLPYSDKRILSLKEKQSQTLQEFKQIFDGVSATEIATK